MGDLEVRRKLFHMLAISLWLVPLRFFNGSLLYITFLMVLILNYMTVLGVGKDMFKLYYRMVYFLERERNYQKPSIQALWANLGIFLSFLLFGRECAMVSTLVLAVGDAFASIVGMRYGRKRIWENRTLEGSVAFFFSSFLVILPLIGFWKALLIAFASALSEVVPVRLDDNLIVPLVSALVCGLAT
ncbi:MAG: phosphatidate cytidylyltransferase [Acidobacteria bacterium]|nr:MAG: phosphatidate cytidylyltransferase [Acidobacteriota bacterium]